MGTLERRQDFTNFINPFSDETKKMLKLGDKYQKIVESYWKVHKQYVRSKRAKKFEKAAGLAIKMRKINVKASKAKYEFDVVTNNALGTKRDITLILQKKAGVLPRSEIKKWEKKVGIKNNKK